MSSPVKQVSPPVRQLLPARQVAERYQIHLASLWRWIATGILPTPDLIINRRRYWYTDSLEAADRQRTIKRAKGWQAAKPVSNQIEEGSGSPDEAA